METSVEAMGMYVELSDRQLVARCRAGDHEAWNELVERFSRYVFAIAVQAFKLSEHDAEDVFQEVFARAYQHLHKLRDDEAIRPWLAQLTRRLCVDTLRASAREHPGEEAVEEPAGVDDTIARLDEALSVHDALSTLPGNCREILERARADQAFRAALLADLEKALEGAGYEPEPALVEALRERFSTI